MFKKAITHVHTHHSYDCLVDPRKIVDKAVTMGIDFLLITDHDSLAGSLEARAYAQKQGYPIEIPIAAEYETDAGDIIVSHVNEGFQPERNAATLCRKAKEQQGFVILPHPYKAHLLDQLPFDLIDCVEIFNSRCHHQDNLQAIALASRLNKPVVYGSDAHTLADLDNAIFVYQGNTPFEGKTEALSLELTEWTSKEFSRFVRGVKLRKPKECLRVIKRCLMRPFQGRR